MAVVRRVSRNVLRGIAGAGGPSLPVSGLDQLLFKSLAPSLAGVIYDERTGVDEEDLANGQLVQSNCINLNGTTQTIDSGYTTAMPIASGSVWAKRDGAGTNYDHLVSKGQLFNAGAYEFAVTVRNTDQVLLYWHNGSSLKNIPGPTIDPDSEFFHIAWMVRNGSQKLWVNGVLSTPKTETTGTSAFEVKIGAEALISSSRHWGGNVLDCRVFDVEIDESDVALLYASPGAVIAKAPIIHYKGSEGAGTVVYDSSGNGNHGTFTNGPNWALQDVYHPNVLDGFEEYTDDATELLTIRVPYEDDGSLITPTISGWAKVRDHDAGPWHNGAESEIDFGFGSNWSFHDSRSNPLFNREHTSGGVVVKADRFVAYDAEQSGQRLADIESYTDTVVT